MSRRTRKGPVATSARPDTLTMAIEAARAVDDKRGEDIIVLDLRGLVDYADFFIIATSRSRKQGQVVAEAVAERLGALGVRPLHIHGAEEGSWVLCDFADVIVHVFRDEARQYYELEQLWGDAPKVAWEPKVRPARPRVPDEDEDDSDEG